ncbi:META domain-containing protein [Variovorax sp. J22R133]|uniref:META domain-containing protein n=1 Tax=Variovorax brevis TaxID=3053503 RepID=UPI002578B39A|nr:META domain-containing protein [Variovorax sp. J22R133]MDM0115364.1 META domain-containing protein [Variovorax sp. J22R133]
MHFLARFAFCRAALPLVLAFAVSGCSSVSLDEPIEARTWRLASIDEQPVIPSQDPQQSAQISFDGANKRVTGSGGCNRITGSYLRTGAQLKIGPLASTRMACIDAGRGQLEARFLAALQATTSYSISGNELILLDARGQTLAKLDGSAR